MFYDVGLVLSTVQKPVEVEGQKVSMPPCAITVGHS